MIRQLTVVVGGVLCLTVSAASVFPPAGLAVFGVALILLGLFVIDDAADDEAES